MAVTNPAAVVRHIIHEEVQHDSETAEKIALDLVSYNENMETDDEAGINSDIDIAFTVHDKQINSKKLIEDIASNSRLIPYIKDNTLFFQGINPSPDPLLVEDDGDVEMYIESSDIISYTNKRTAPEKVYTKVVVNYHYDYALKDFSENTLDNSQGSDTATEWFDINGEGGYDITNLGLKAEQDLPFDAHYIRDKNSAEALQEFLLLWHCNQHNVLKLRLPLKYIQLKIGDYIGFDKLINGVKLFGEDYSISGWKGEVTYRNGQQILPVWMVTSTNKTLTHIDVEMIQMHNCTPTVTDSLDVPPEFDGVGLELIGDWVENHNIVLSDSDTSFQVKLTAINASDDNIDDVISYYFLSPSVSYMIALGVQEQLSDNEDINDLANDMVIDNELFDNIDDSDLYSENNVTLELGESPGDGGHGEWLTNWLTSPSHPSGSYLEFPSNFFQVVATDGESVPLPPMPSPSFKIHKNYIIYPETTALISYDEGWNLISIPIEVEDANYQTLFPDAAENSAYYFHGSYFQPQDDILEVGKGYWMYFTQDGNVTLEGNFVEPNWLSDTQYSILVQDGWNLIGGLHYGMHYQDHIVDYPEDIITPGSLYGFSDGGYLQRVELIPGNAYWLNINLPPEDNLGVLSYWIAEELIP